MWRKIYQAVRKYSLRPVRLITHTARMSNMALRLGHWQSNCRTSRSRDKRAGKYETVVPSELNKRGSQPRTTAEQLSRYDGTWANTRVSPYDRFTRQDIFLLLSSQVVVSHNCEARSAGTPISIWNAHLHDLPRLWDRVAIQLGRDAD
jgi:hypothetical protein